MKPIQKRVRVRNRDNQIVRQHESPIQESFQNGVSNVEEEINEDELEDLVASGSALTIAREFDWELFEDNLSETQSDIKSAHDKGMDVMVPRLEELGFVGAVATIGSVRAENWIQQQNGELINSVVSETQRAVQQAVNRGIQQGQAVSQTAIDVRNSVGLTQRQEAAVANFRRMLVQQDSNAIGRFLTGSEKQQVRSIVQSGGTTQEINNLTRRYRNHQLNIRADKIARHQSKLAVERGKLNQIRDLHDQGIVNKNAIRKVWLSALLPTTCPFCENLHETVLQVEQQFTGEHRLQDGSLRVIQQITPPAHARCQCWIEYRTV